MKKIIISGYFGAGNFGDELILDIMLSELKERFDNPEIVVMSVNPHYTYQKHPDLKIIIKDDWIGYFAELENADLLISGGGGLLQNKTSFFSLMHYLMVLRHAQKRNVKTVVLAQGIGPINGWFSKSLTKQILEKVNLITVRDFKSYKLLMNWGLDATKTADLGWLMDSSSQSKNDGEKKTLTLNLRTAKHFSGANVMFLARAIVETFSPKEYKFKLLPLQQGEDFMVLNNFGKLLQLLDKDLDYEIKTSLSNQEIIKEIALSDYYIGMRYHGIMACLKQNVPVLAISYDDKVSTLATDSDTPWFSVEDLRWEQDKVLEQFQKLIKKDYELDKSFVNSQQLLAKKNFDMLEE